MEAFAWNGWDAPGAEQALEVAWEAHGDLVDLFCEEWQKMKKVWISWAVADSDQFAYRAANGRIAKIRYTRPNTGVICHTVEISTGTMIR